MREVGATSQQLSQTPVEFSFSTASEEKRLDDDKIVVQEYTPSNPRRLIEDVLVFSW